MVLHTNTVEGDLSIFKRRMNGIYQHSDKKHLHRYAAEFEFRYKNLVPNGVAATALDDVALEGGVGKRLIRQRP